ncbi:MAG: hypothetical protein QS748_13730 [Candidatus Endonucleobacter bathymodioli]|uniref:Uncharacterized protein n=1 Tax=Candidatus Endonucleibacter bathymodioli TaxID=539814 RepID=A0AA90P127_9GAMM|nr:hypothetical protein [Candidatus Endonucleobacter bathymodioli]
MPSIQETNSQLLQMIDRSFNRSEENLGKFGLNKHGVVIFDQSMVGSDDYCRLVIHLSELGMDGARLENRNVKTSEVEMHVKRMGSQENNKSTQRKGLLQNWFGGWFGQGNTDNQECPQSGVVKQPQTGYAYKGARPKTQLQKDHSVNDKAGAVMQPLPVASVEAEAPQIPWVSHIDCRSSGGIVRDSIYIDQTIKRSERLVITRTPGVGGAGSVGYDLAVNNPGHKIGIMVSANSGLPAGDIGHVVLGHKIKSFDHYLNNGGQEENLVANWALTAFPASPDKQKELIRSTIMDQWGMEDMSNNTDSVKTKQGIDYVKTTSAEKYGEAWVVGNAKLSALQRQSPSNKNCIIDSSKTFDASLIFGAGINASNNGTPTGTMQRTRNVKATTDYKFFCEAVKNVIRVKLDAGIAEGVTVFAIDLTSCGIYSGHHKHLFNRQYMSLLQAVLDERVGPQGEHRWEFIHDAVVADRL